ncbi:AAA family ATPase [Methylobacter marinus]|uniref:AAA family ATPase n=1 Tax=Methylobacter marinus TaxID=34058 RepID=UPI00036A29CB|nr:AAA family ATPase [Methylobacter marinus]
MASADQLKALLKSHIDGDNGHFYAVAMQLAAHEAKLGHGKLAEELRSIIDAGKAQSSPLISAGKRPTPIIQPRGEMTTLLDASYQKARLAEIVLDKTTEEHLQRIIKEQRNYAKIQAHGLSPRRKILLVGPPGTGKTLTASVLAGELGIPLFVVRLDALITKFMGETAAKLRQVFDTIASMRGIYFFDEFDAIGAQRGFINDVGEIRRVLNSFLQMLERDESNSVIIAATNHPQALDYALFRRFDDVIEYGLPNPTQIIEVLKFKLSGFKIVRPVWTSLAEIAEGLSHAELTRAVQDAIKDAVIHDRNNLTNMDLEKMLKERQIMKQRKIFSPEI